MPQNMPGQGLGHFFGAMRVDAFRPKDEFFEHIDKWINRFRSAKPAAGFEKVLIPGDIEREMELERMNSGIPNHLFSSRRSEKSRGAGWGKI